MKDLMETARKASYEFYKMNPHLDYQELISEAYLAMVEAVNTWKPDGGRSLNSWVVYVVEQKLCKEFGRSINNIDFGEVEELAIAHSSDPDCINPEILMCLNDTISSMSQTSREIIRAIFQEEITPTKLNKNAVTKEIKKYLRNKGVSWCKIQEAFKELRQYANSLA